MEEEVSRHGAGHLQMNANVVLEKGAVPLIQPPIPPLPTSHLVQEVEAEAGTGRRQRRHILQQSIHLGLQTMGQPANTC